MVSTKVLTARHEALSVLLLVRRWLAARVVNPF